MGSSRFPNKVLQTIHDKPILEHIVNSLKHSKLTDQIIIATTNLPEDDVIEKIAKNLNVDCYRGSANDVLARFYDCAKFFKGDLIVRINGDNPLLDPQLVDEAILVCKKSGCDYVSNVIHQSYPLGIHVEVFSFAILKQIHETQKDALSREHVTYHIRKNLHLYNTKEILAPNGSKRPNWRLTIDYPEDLELMNKIFSILYNPNFYISYDSVVNLLDENPDFLRINNKYTTKDLVWKPQ